MLRPKISELGKLSLLEDGGLVSSVTSDELPLIGPSALRAAFLWASPDLSELAVGDLAAHWDYGVARFKGRSQVAAPGGGQSEFLILEFAEGRELYVHAARFDLVQKVRIPPAEPGASLCEPLKAA